MTDTLRDAAAARLGDAYSLPVEPPRPPRSARSTRGLFVALTLLMFAIVGGGFWPYFSRIGRGDGGEQPWPMHLHAAVFTGWMVLLLVQVSLVWRRRTNLHRRIGRFGIAYGVLVLLMGVVAMIVAPTAHVVRGEWPLDQAASFLLVPIGDMMLFGTLFGLGVAYRRRPEFHKRYMLLATVALMFAPANRLVGEAGAVAVVGAWLLPVAIAVADDLRTRRRVHVAYVIGTAVLLVGFARVFFLESPAWIRFGRQVVIALRPAVERLL